MDLDVDLVYERIAAAVNGANLMGATKKVTAAPYSPDALDPPHLQLAEFIGDFDKSFGGLMELVITARLMLARSDKDGIAGQQEARRLAGAGSNTLKAAFRQMRGAAGQDALSGACSDIHLRRITGPRLYDYGEAHYYGLELTIFVMG